MDFSVIGIDGGWFIEAWRSSNGWVDQAQPLASMCRVEPTSLFRG